MPSETQDRPVFEVRRRPTLEHAFWVLECGFPVSNSPLHMETAVAFPHTVNDCAGESRSVEGQISNESRDLWKGDPFRRIAK
jgi:hypothetical protein